MLSDAEATRDGGGGEGVRGRGEEGAEHATTCHSILNLNVYVCDRSWPRGGWGRGEALAIE